MTRLDIDACKKIQREQGLLDTHVVSLDERGFTIAHTDDERAKLPDLEQCALHKWLRSEGPPEVGPGLYTASTHEPDGYSESYRSDPWTFEPLEIT